MYPRTNLSLRHGMGALLVASLTALLGCATSVGDIDRTQPNLIHKSVFQGEWFVRQTVVDVPPTSMNNFVGMTGEMEMIRWEIQEDLLIGYRSYEFVPGSDENADRTDAGVNNQPVAPGHGEGQNPNEYKENPIVAYPIISQVDVQRSYNPQTGEQTNVIVENSSDRPWYEREYIRVDWSRPQVANWTFLVGADTAGFTNSYYVQDSQKGDDALTMARKGDTDEVNYLDFTSRLMAQPDFSCILMSYYGELGDCASAEIKVRTSFLKVDAAREKDFEVTEYSDNRMGEFGYFRTERNTYDRKRGVTWTGKIYLANHHDIWSGSVDAEGKEVPYIQRGLRPIVYTISTNYPKEMLPVTQEIASDWDKVVKETASAARGQTIAQLEADLQSQTGQTCYFCLDLNEDGHARIGDLRYNFMAWVDNPQLESPLGYGPSQAHPQTGRIVSGEAFVYGAAIDTYVSYAKDIVDLLNGDITDDQVEVADYLKTEVMNRKSSLDPNMMERFNLMPINDQFFESRLLGWDRASKVDALQKGEFPAARPNYLKTQFEKIRGTSLETSLFDDELVTSMSHGKYKAGDAIPADFADKISPAEIGTADFVNVDRQRHELAEKNTIWLADFSDPNILGLAKSFKDKGLTGDALYQALREQIYRGVMLHEVGHTLGLRHNFGGSADALNYFDAYWPLRQKTDNVISGQLTLGALMEYNCSQISDANRASCAEQQEGRMAEYQYSTIMDYGGRFNSDVQGLGKYDEAAIAAVYGNLVQVFTDEAVARMVPGFSDEVRYVASIDNPLYGTLTQFYHYSQLPQLFGGADNMKKSSRKWLSRADFQTYAEANAAEEKKASAENRQPLLTGPVRVPYYACYDEYRDSTPYCHTFDIGADNYEITKNWVDYYHSYYVFDSFQRDRVSYSPSDTYSRVLSRYFIPIQNMYQHWLFEANDNSIQHAYSTTGMIEGFETIWNALAIPENGSYYKDGDAYKRCAENEAAQCPVYNPATEMNEMKPVDLYVPRGVGQPIFSKYDYDSGYFLFNRVLESGSYWVNRAALVALTYSDSPVGLGQDRAANFLAYSLPYYLAFQRDIDNLFAGVVQSDSKAIGPQVINGALVGHHPILGDEAEPATVSGHVELDVPFSTRIYTMLYGSAGLSVNYDLSFLQGSQVAIEGSGETLQPADGFVKVTFSDPGSGRVYAAYKPATDDGHRWLAAEIIDHLNAVKTDMADSNAKTQEISSKVQDLELLRGMYKSFGSAF